MWQNWVIGVLGLWVILMPFIGFDSMTWLVITGLVIAILGFWNAMQKGGGGMGM